MFHSLILNVLLSVVILQFPAIIELNVGGHCFTTTLLTLTKCPDNMLSAMFSGKYAVVKDKDGRYFIDADGAHFIHILNYLRNGDIPPANLAEVVYREAAYFGIHGLVSALERNPTILGKIQRSNFRKQFSGYSECIESIIKAASKETKSQMSDVKVLIFRKENKPEDKYFDMDHICEGQNNGKLFECDARLGPWKSKDTEKDVLSCIMYDLECQGFAVTSRFYGPCTYVYESDTCKKVFYNICFYWWK